MRSGQEMPPCTERSCNQRQTLAETNQDVRTSFRATLRHPIRSGNRNMVVECHIRASTHKVVESHKCCRIGIAASRTVSSELLSSLRDAFAYFQTTRGRRSCGTVRRCYTSYREQRTGGRPTPSNSWVCGPSACILHVSPTDFVPHRR